MIKSEHLKAFFEAKPAVNKSAFAREAGVTERHFRRLNAGTSQITPEMSARFRKLFNKYGYYVD